MTSGSHVDEIAKLIAQKFIERRDVKAVQTRGGYAPVVDNSKAAEPQRLPWKMGDLRDHVNGTKTYGHYMVSPEGNCRLFAFDIDLTKKGTWKDDAGIEHAINPREAWLQEGHPARHTLATQLRYIAEGLAVRTERLAGIRTAVAYSGHKGLHVYGLTGAIAASEARSAAKAVLDSYKCFTPMRGDNFYMHDDGHYPNIVIEVYPKQDSLEGKDLGNLMRLPLGVNRASGQEGFFIDQDADDHIIAPVNPLPVLARD